MSNEKPSPRVEMLPIDKIISVRWHEALPDDLRVRATALYQSVGRYLSDSLDAWVDGFCHNLDLESEIVIFERIALAWKRFRRDYPEAERVSSALLIPRLVCLASGTTDPTWTFTRELLACYQNPTKKRRKR